VSSLEKHVSSLTCALDESSLPPEVAECVRLLRAKGHPEEVIHGFVGSFSASDDLSDAFDSIIRDVSDRCKSLLRGLSKMGGKGPKTPLTQQAQQARAATADKNDGLVSALLDLIRAAHSYTPDTLAVLAERSGSSGAANFCGSLVKEWGQIHPVCASMRQKDLPASTVSAVCKHLSERRVIVDDDKAVVPMALVTRSGALSQHVTESCIGFVTSERRVKPSRTRILPASPSTLSEDLGLDCVHVLFTNLDGKSILCPSEFVGSDDLFGVEYVPRALVYLGKGTKAYSRALLECAYPPKISCLGVGKEDNKKRGAPDGAAEEGDAKRPKFDETDDDIESD